MNKQSHVYYTLTSLNCLFHLPTTMPDWLSMGIGRLLHLELFNHPAQAKIYGRLPEVPRASQTPAGRETARQLRGYPHHKCRPMRLGFPTRPGILLSTKAALERNISGTKRKPPKAKSAILTTLAIRTRRVQAIHLSPSSETILRAGRNRDQWAEVCASGKRAPGLPEVSHSKVSVASLAG